MQDSPSNYATRLRSILILNLHARPLLIPGDSNVLQPLPLLIRETVEDSLCARRPVRNVSTPLFTVGYNLYRRTIRVLGAEDVECGQVPGLSCRRCRLNGDGPVVPRLVVAGVLQPIVDLLLNTCQQYGACKTQRD